MATSKTQIAVAVSALTTPAPDERQFYSIDGTDIRVCHADGSIAVVTGKPRLLPRKLWRAAVASGCQILRTGEAVQQASDPVGDALTDGDDAEKRHAAIVDLFNEMLDAAEDDPAYADAFTGAGLPNVRYVEKRLGFSISAGERDAAWAEANGAVGDEAGDDAGGDAE